MKSRLTLAALLLLALVSYPAGGAAPEHFTGTVANPAGAPGRTTTAPVSIHIYSYSSDEEMQRLNDLFTSKGTQALREELFDLEKGWLRIGDSLGYPIAVARSQTLADGSRRVVIVADRPIQFFEAWNNARSLDYPFSVVELRLGSDGKGEGDMTAAAKVLLINGDVRVESVGVQPARLLGVRTR